MKALLTSMPALTVSVWWKDASLLVLGRQRLRFRGGCSTMGTLSGGNNVIISVGEGCLIGANAGLGIVLGDRRTVEAEFVFNCR